MTKQETEKNTLTRQVEKLPGYTIHYYNGAAHLDRVTGYGWKTIYTGTIAATLATVNAILAYIDAEKG